MNMTRQAWAAWSAVVIGAILALVITLIVSPTATCKGYIHHPLGRGAIETWLPKCRG